MSGFDFFRCVLNLVCPGRVQRRRRLLSGTANPEALEQRQVLAASMLGAVTPGGRWSLDTNGGGAAEIDRNFGLPGDQFVVGNWNGTGDQPGVVRVRPDGFLHWYLNTDASVSPEDEIDFLFGRAGDIPVVGDWNGDGKTDVGVVRRNDSGGLDWLLDLNRDPNPEWTQSFGLPGDIPVVGDWDNNGTSNVGTVRQTGGYLMWHMDVTGDEWPEVSRIFGLAGDVPVVGDWDGNGTVDIGVARPAAANGGLWEWYRDINGDPNPDLPVVRFGSTNSHPVTGRWNFSEVDVAIVTGSGDQAIVNGRGGAETISYGTSVQGDPPKEVTFLIRNTGNAALQLSQLTVPAGFVVTDPLVSSLAPGQQDLLKVRLSTTTAGQYSGNVVFQTNDGNESPFRFTIAGRVEARSPQIQVTDNGAFGEIISGTSGAPLRRTFTISNSGNSELTYSAAVDGTHFRIISGQSGTVPRGASTTVIVEMHSTTTGDKTGKLTVSSNAVNVASPISRVLSAVVVAASRNLELTGSGSFGTVGLNATGEVRERLFTIVNSGNAPLTYSAVSSNGQFVVVSGASGVVAPGGGMAAVLIRMTTGTVATRNGRLTITSDATVEPTRTVTLSGEVVRGTPQIEVAETMHFGQLVQNATNTSSQRELIVRNLGTAPLTFTSSMSNTQFAITSGAGSVTVPAGGTARIVVRMLTATTGSKSGTLTIQSNDSRRPVLHVQLTGTVSGITDLRPEADVKIGTKTLAPGETGQMFYSAAAMAIRQQTFTIHNSGSGVLNVSNPMISGEFTHNMPASFNLAPGATRTITVRLLADSVGTKIGKLQFSTNDSDEGHICIRLLGRQLEPVTRVQGSAISPTTGEHTIYHAGLSTLFVDPSHGRTPMNGSLTVSGGSTLHFTSALSRLVIVSSTRPNVQNWTSVAVVWKSPNGLIALPRAQSRPDLFSDI